MADTAWLLWQTPEQAASCLLHSCRRQAADWTNWRRALHTNHGEKEREISRNCQPRRAMDIHFAISWLAIKVEHANTTRNIWKRTVVPNQNQVSTYSNTCAQVLRGGDENYARQSNIMTIHNSVYCPYMMCTVSTLQRSSISEFVVHNDAQLLNGRLEHGSIRFWYA